MRSEFVSGKRRQLAHEAAKRGAGSGDDDDGIGGFSHDGAPWEMTLDYGHHMMRRKKCNRARHEKMS
jgi:hypothetical protein